jgi:hypothetical protein
MREYARQQFHCTASHGRRCRGGLAFRSETDSSEWSPVKSMM